MSGERPGITRRAALKGGGAAVAAAALGAAGVARPRLAAGEAAPREDRAAGEASGPRLLFAVKYGMVGGPAPMADKLRLLRDLGFDGVEMDSPNGYAPGEVEAAVEASGLPVHGVVDSRHWQVRLSDPDPDTRRRAVADLEGAIRHSKAYGGSSVLLVPGRVADPSTESHDHVWRRSIAGIRSALPLAAELGIRILIENVWNGFCYDHDGPADQGAERLAAYLDEIASPWVGAYFDIGNHRKYGAPEQWIRTLGPRIVKLDVKDWGRADGWTRIGDGDVSWPAVRQALRDIGFTGWCTAEVSGGDRERLADVKRRMDAALRGGAA